MNVRSGQFYTEFQQLRPVLAKNVSADTIIKEGQGLLYGVSITDGTVAVHDGTDATGTKLLELTAPSTGSVVLPMVSPLQCGLGIFVDVTGSPSVNVLYR